MPQLHGSFKRVKVLCFEFLEGYVPSLLSLKNDVSHNRLLRLVCIFIDQLFDFLLCLRGFLRLASRDVVCSFLQQLQSLARKAVPRYKRHICVIVGVVRAVPQSLVEVEDKFRPEKRDKRFLSPALQVFNFDDTPQVVCDSHADGEGRWVN